MSKIPVFLSKLTPPPIPGQSIERPRLIAQLSQLDSSGLGLICAAAGYGKTLLMLQYGQQKDGDLAWISLDKKDNNLNRFIAHLVGAFALANLLPDVLAEQAHSLLPEDPEQAWALALNQIHQHTAPVLLVLDNADHIRAPRVLDHINRLIEYAPDNLQILMAGRSRPRITSGKLRSEGRLLELNSADLSFTADEVEMLCHQTQVVAGPGEIHQLCALSEGWVTGIRLWLVAGRSFGTEPLHAPSVADLAYQYIEEYFTEEVIAPLPLPARQLLLQTSIVNRFNQPLANLLTALPDKAVQLQRLQKQNLFLQPTGYEQGWYRYHPLLQHSLYQLLCSQAPEHARALHQRAAHWLLQNGHYGDSLYQYGRSHDIETLLTVIEKYSFELLREGKVNEIINSLENIPAPLGEDHFTLVTTEASVVHVIKDTARIKSCIGRLQRLLHNPPPYANAARLRQTSLFLRAHIAYLGGNFHYGIRLCDSTLQQQEEPNAAISIVRFHRANSHFALGNLSKAHQDASQALSELQNYGLVGYTNSLIFLLGQIEISQGKVSQAKHLYQNMRPSPGGPAASQSFYDAYYFLGMGLVHTEQNQLSLAESFLKQAVTIALRIQPSAILPWVLHQLALVHFCSNNREQAANVWDEAISIALHHRLYGIYRLCSAYRVRLALTLPEKQIWCEKWLQKWDQILRLYGEHTLPEERLAYGWVQYHQGSWNEAFRTSELLIAELKEQGNISLLIDAHILMSSLLYSKERNEMALKAFNQAVDLALENNMPRLFFLEGRELLDLIQLALSERSRRQQAIQSELSHRVFVEQLITSLTPAARVTTAKPMTSPLFEPLTKREGDVLESMMKGQSNQEIAGSLFIGISTVKTHINSIFRKLDVDSRQEACRVATRFQVQP